MTVRPTLRILLVLISMGLLAGAAAFQQEKMGFREIADWAKLPADVQLGGVSGIGIDSKDRVFVLQRIKPFVLVFEADGKFVRAWNGDFKTPHGLRIDRDDNVWVADMANHLVQKFTPEGRLLLKLGEKDKAAWDEGHFNKPADIGFGPKGEIFVGDGYGNSRIARFSADGMFQKEWGKRGKADGEFNIPHAVVYDGNGKLYVGDRENARVQIFDTDGKHQATWNDTGYPYGLALRQDRVYVGDGRSGEVRVLDTRGKTLARWAAGTPKSAPHWLAVDSAGHLYVGFVSGKKLQKWAP
jgi:DNA-binding beta-propeller fold protein YncE